MSNIDRMLSDIQREVELTRRLTGKDSLDDRVMDAMEQVPRHLFVPDESQIVAYENGPVPIGYGQTISQPYIVALMTDLLNTQPDQVILEVGTGSCYQSVILSHLVKQVYTIEIVEDLAKQARARLKRLGYTNVEVRAGDGNSGWPEHAPFDGIIVTAAAPFIPQALIDQLKTGGCLVIPVGQPYLHQELMVVEKKENGEIDTRDILAVAFVPLIGDDNDSTSE